MGFRRALVALNSVLSRAVAAIAVVLVVAIVILTFTEVVTRFVLNDSILWVQEVALLLLIWSVFLGGAICFRSGSHLAIDLVRVDRNSMMGRVKEALVAMACLAISVAFVYYGWLLAVEGASRSTPVLGIPLVYGWSAPILSGLLSLPFVLESWLVPGNVEAHLVPPGAGE